VRYLVFEVWNEPNSPDSGKVETEGILRTLTNLTSKTIKSVVPLCEWEGLDRRSGLGPEFLAHVKQSGAAVDFVTTHTYGVKGLSR